MTAAENPTDLHRVPRRRPDPVVDWLDGKREVIDGLAVLDGHVIAETVEFTADPPHPQRYLPPVGWIPIDENIATPIFDGLDADCQPSRTPTGRVSRKPPRLPYTGGVAYQVFVDGSRDDHHSYFHGGRR
jgi:hypothetical protein